MGKNSRIQRTKNFTSGIGAPFAAGSPFAPDATEQRRQAGIRNLTYTISPIQLQRIRTDLKIWRQAVDEAERAYWPYRVKMQRMFIDNILNGHTISLMERRKDLTLIRKYQIVDEKGVKSDVLTQALRDQPWFYNFQSYALDALFYGYSLISLGDIVNDAITNVSIVPRWFVSPDRMEVSRVIYSPAGTSFREGEVADWHIYIPTSSDNGVSPCGYGLLYSIAQYEIIVRNTLGYNADFVELFAQPYRVGKTNKTEEHERSEMASALQNMGSRGWAVVDPDESIEFIESKLSGTGWQSYLNLMEICQKTISKVILGHADAMDSTPGKLGGTQGKGSDGMGEPGSTTDEALRDKQTKDGRFMEPIINTQLIPRLRKLPQGLIIPDGYRFEYTNDQEAQQQRAREDNTNLNTAKIAQTMKSAGLQMDAKYFEERTGIPTTASPMPGEGLTMPGFSNRIQNKLRQLYKGQKKEGE
jgi:phage gp29-like protein